MRSEAAKKSLYEYTKDSQQNLEYWRKETELKNRHSNITWGLKAQSKRYESSSSKADPLNLTFSSVKTGNEITREMNSIDSTRTAKNLTSSNAAITNRHQILHSLELNRNKSPFDGEKHLAMVNRPGKKIDMHHEMKQSTVASHIINANSQDPQTFEKSTSGHVARPTINHNMSTNIQLAH